MSGKYLKEESHARGTDPYKPPAAAGLHENLCHLVGSLHQLSFIFLSAAYLYVVHLEWAHIHLFFNTDEQFTKLHIDYIDTLQ